MNSTVLVRGVSKGIGRAIALKLAADGFTVVVHYHSDQQGAQATLDEITAHGGSGRLIQFDIGDRIWNLDLFQTNPQIVLGEHSDPDCTIKMSEENFEKMIRKQLNIPLAIITGKIKLQGDRTLALKLGELFS